MDFIDYITKTLRWPLCLTPGPVAAVSLGLARVFNGVVKDIHWLRDQFNPATCDDKFLSRLAESRGIVRHRLETDDVKFRQRVVKAFAWQLLGGKKAGMPKLLDHFGYKVGNILNVRSEDSARWAEFKISFAPLASGFCAADYDLLNWAINESKPARSKLAAIVFSPSLESPAFTGGIVRTGSIQHVPVQCSISVDPACLYSGAKTRGADIVYINLLNSLLEVDPVGLYSGGAVQVTDIINLRRRNA